jgi:hypothetical protein
MIRGPGGRLPAVGEILATAFLVVLPGGEETPLWHRPSDGSLVLAFLHGAGCHPCVEYATALAESSSTYRSWGGQAILVVSAAGPAARRLAGRVPLRVAADPGGAARSRWRIGRRDAALVVTDRWRQVYAAWNAGGSHKLPSPSGEVADTLALIGIQCPECGVPDVPAAPLGEGLRLPSLESLEVGVGEPPQST